MTPSPAEHDCAIVSPLSDVWPYALTDNRRIIATWRRSRQS